MTILINVQTKIYQEVHLKIRYFYSHDNYNPLILRLLKNIDKGIKNKIDLSSTIDFYLGEFNICE